MIGRWDGCKKMTQCTTFFYQSTPATSMYSYQQLTVLPDLPPTPIEINCSNNQLTALPDNLLSPLQIKYPRYLIVEVPPLMSFANYVNYVSEEQTRITERTQNINQNNILLELYMKRTMHPDKIDTLLKEAGDNADIDAVNAAYVESL
jgi:hypothetical protein